MNPVAETVRQMIHDTITEEYGLVPMEIEDELPDLAERIVAAVQMNIDLAGPPERGRDVGGVAGLPAG